MIMNKYFIKVNLFVSKKHENGTTAASKKTPLISKEFFYIKNANNDKSMTWESKSHEDRLRIA